MLNLWSASTVLTLALTWSMHSKKIKAVMLLGGKQRLTYQYFYPAIYGGGRDVYGAGLQPQITFWLKQGNKNNRMFYI
jgi:hypothetical protein